jgi:uncharacterized membrane protein
VTRSDQRWMSRGVVAVVVVLNAIVLAPELDIARIDLNDSVFHYTIAHRLTERLSAGQPVLDFWMPEWSFGYPVVREYQPLAHWLVALAHFATFRQFPFDALFAFVRWLLLAIFPLSAYAACRWMGMRSMTAASVALLSPLIASPNLYGLEYGSYVWRGNGLFTQLVAMHLFVLTIGAGCRAIRGRRGVSVASLLLALTFLSHYIYGYMAAATLVLIAALPAADPPPRRRLVRLGWIAALSFALAAFQILPMLGDGAFINRSRWEPAWKWDSFGLAQVLGLTASGNLLDAYRLPALSLLSLIGAIAVVRRRRAPEEGFAETFALAGALLWLFLFCGRATWGPLFTAIGLSSAAQIHRFIGGAQWFLLILAGFGLTRLWAWPGERRWRYPRFAAVVLVALALLPAILERARFLREGTEWGRVNLNAYASNRDALDRTIAAARAMGGRSYPGLAAGWGPQLRVGYVPLYAFLSEAHVPAVAFLYHAMALPADIMVRFDETRPEHYRLFDVRSIVADAARALPAFLRPVASQGPFRILQPPAAGAFDLVQAPQSVYVDGRTFYDINDAWLQSRWPAAGAHLLLDYESRTPADARPRLAALDALQQLPPPAACGSVTAETSDGEIHRADLVAGANCYALFKSTYHPNWQATIDGAPRPVVMLSPGFVGVRVPPGRHRIELRYVPGRGKIVLLFLALPLLFVSVVAEKRGAVVAVERRLESLPIRWTRDAAYALILAALLLPVIAPVAGRVQPNGHDALEYLPRVVEFHENIRHGILLPRWAPDLSSGQGQPLFLFNPPLFYYLSEAFYLAGLGFVAAMNAACVLLVIAAAASMFLLGRWFFGAAGGLLAALAYVYAPYFLSDLYVRTAFAEFSAFPFYPLALYGFARHAAERRLRDLLIGVVAYAMVWFAHSPAAALFSPLLGAWIVFLAWRARSGRLFATHAAAVVLALSLAACIWLPGVAEAKETHAEWLTTGPLKYTNHYLFPAQFFSARWGYGVSVPGDQDGMPFGLGWAELLIAAVAVVFLVRSGDARWKEWAIFFAGAAFALCFLMTHRAHAVWDALPQLQYVAFPWRLLAPVTCCIALLVSAIALVIARLPERWRTAALTACAAAIVLTGVKHAEPVGYLSLDPELWTPPQIAARGVVPATFDTFEPRWVAERPVFRGQGVLVTRGSATVATTARTPVRLDVAVRAASEADLELPIAYFPGWRVRLDGVEQPTDNLSPTGKMRLTVGAGEHRVEATFGRTPLRVIADVVSAAAALLILVVALRPVVARRRRR